MKINSIKTLAYSSKDTLVVGVFLEEALTKEVLELDRKFSGLITHTIQNSYFTGEITQYEIINNVCSLNLNRIILVGLGKREGFTPLSCQDVGRVIVKALKKHPNDNVVIVANELSTEQASAVCLGLLEETWVFDKYKTEVKSKAICNSIQIFHQNNDELNTMLNRSKAIIEGLFYAKGLVSEPSNYLTPEVFANQCKVLEKLGVEVEVMAIDELSKLNMNSLLGAAKGSVNLPYVVVMKYNPKSLKAIQLALVGKGVCFDAGGISIKPYKGMSQMRYDMAGAAAVVGALIAIAKQNLPVSVVGIIGLIENMPSGNALKPGDVITSMSGKTIEVISTDAEGRLVLADCLYYTETRFQPQIMIDLATLTPETAASLSSQYGGLYTDDEELALSLTQAGLKSGDLVWRLPMGEIFKKQIISRIADMKNLGNEGDGENGAAAEFLKNFINKSIWAHLDIGAAAFKEEEIENELKVSGYGVKILEEFITSLI